MKSSWPAFLALLTALVIATPLETACAAISTTGNVEPADPASWTSYTDCYIGRTDDGTLHVDLDSDLLSQYGFLGYDYHATGEATIDGAGSTWTNSYGLMVGHTGSGVLNVLGGGVVSNNYDGYIGYYFMSDSTSEVSVDGAGSTWTNNANLYAGYYGNGTLNITNGGTVSVADQTYVGFDGNSSGIINFGANGGTLTTGSLYCDSPSQLEGAGTINTRGLINDIDLVFDASHGASQTLTLTDSGQNITLNLDMSGASGVPGDLGAGYRGAGTLAISDGVAVESQYGYLGYHVGSTGEATISGTGSTWTNSSELYVGRHGSGTLNITDGGEVGNTQGYIGGSTGEATVNGAGSSWTNSSYLDVGYIGSGRLNIISGGVVSSAYGMIGHSSSSTGAVTVDGVGSNWTNSGELNIGLSGSGALNITDGGAVSNTRGRIGASSGSTGEATVDGVGSSWNNTNSLDVGYHGSGVLNITGGAAVSNTYGYIGYSPGSAGEVTVDGSDSSWANSSALCVGRDGSGELNITNGGEVSVVGTTYVGYDSDSTGAIDFGVNGGTLTTGALGASFTHLKGTGTINARGLVSDIDLVFDVSHGPTQTLDLNGPGQNITLNLDMSAASGKLGDLGAGYNGNGTLAIQDGIVVASQGGYLGHKSGSTGEATVDGVNSTWTNSAPFYVGLYGNGTLNITGGGEVGNTIGSIGYKSGSTGEVTVDGAGSTWTNSSKLYVGHYGNGTLNITGGGAVGNTIGYIGHKSGSTGEVTVDGVGSTWTNSSSLYVGRTLSAALNITGGGAVRNTDGYIGGSAGSTSRVTVDGTGSTWTNSGNLYAGFYARVTLTISDGGLVSVDGTLTIDFDNDGDGFVDMRGGGMLALAGDADDSIDSFMDLIEGSDAIRYWNESTLLWENITGASAGSDYMLEYQDSGDLAGYTLLTVLADIPLLGDSNLDDCVDVIDLGTLATNYGTTSGMNWAMGDFNFDGAVDVGDLGILASHYGESSSGASVPEPCSIALLICGIVSLICWRRGK